jgi:DNA-binding Lrp family transcriptional regulator
MKAYVVITTKAGKALEIAHSMGALPGVKMADACWGSHDVYSVVEVQNWSDLNNLILEKVQLLPGVERTETHVTVAA